MECCHECLKDRADKEWAEKIYKYTGVDFIPVRSQSDHGLAPMEKMSEMEDAFKKFLGLENFTLIQGNVGAKKPYADLYQKFKDEFQIPKKFVDELYTSKFMKFCYEDAEIEVFREKWAKNIV